MRAFYSLIRSYILLVFLIVTLLGCEINGEVISTGGIINRQSEQTKAIEPMGVDAADVLKVRDISFLEIEGKLKT